MNNSELHVQGCLAHPRSNDRLPGQSCYIVHLYADISLGMADESMEQLSVRNLNTADQIYEFLRNHITAESFNRLKRRFAGHLPGEA